MRIAVTGGIGAGKSEVMRIIASMGYETVSADEVNAELLQNPAYIRKIASLFPTAVRDNAVDRNILREIVFSDDGERKKLNAVAHPLIINEILKISDCDVFVEMPLLTRDIQSIFDKIIVVNAPEKLRIERIISRSRGEIGREMAEKIIASQPDFKELSANAHFNIENNGDIVRLKDEAARVINELNL